MEPEDWSFDVLCARHDDMKGGGRYQRFHSRVTVSRAEFPRWEVAAQVAAGMAVSRWGGMPVAVLCRD